MNKDKLENKPHKLIQNQRFLEINDLKHYIEWDALPGISFINCSFEEVSLVGKVFGSCNFENCAFNYFNVRKGTLSGCYFKGCKITNSDMTRAYFYDTHFADCKFLGVDLAASDFDSCKFETTIFSKSNLNFISFENVKVWKLKEWLEIKDSFSFQKYLDEENLDQS